MAIGDAYVFPAFLAPVLILPFFPKQPTTFLTCFCRGERRKYAGKKSHLNRGSNSQTPGHESDALTTEPPGRFFFFFLMNPARINLSNSDGIVRVDRRQGERFADHYVLERDRLGR